MVRLTKVGLWLGCLLVLAARAPKSAAGDGEFDSAKWKLQANCWISYPTGYFNGQNNQGYFDLQRDFGFSDYATFSGRLDWRFKRKHHFLFTVNPVVSSQTTTLRRTIEWQGETFGVGGRIKADITSLIFSPGYQYDILRRNRGSLGFLVNLNLAYTQAKLKATGAITGSGGPVSGTSQASGSIFAPLPAIGPTFRFYPIPGSSRFYVDGTLTGMSFFGYGNFVSANSILGFPVSRHWDARAGYSMGSRLKISDSGSGIGIRLTQKGPLFGVEYHWGIR